MLPIIQALISNFVSTYRRHYSADHILICLTENWKKNLYNNNIVGAIFMDLSKVFDCISRAYFTYTQNGSLWLQGGLSYFFTIILEASKTIHMFTVCSKFYSPVPHKGLFSYKKLISPNFFR